MGWYTSLALDAEGNSHVSYYDATTFDLKYARKSGGVWMIGTADESANIVGWYTSLALDAAGSPHISYLDATSYDLKYARSRWIAIGEDGAKAPLAGAASSGELDALVLSASPNPSPHEMIIFWRVPGEMPVELVVFDMSGRRIRTLASGPSTAGAKSAAWDGRDDSGRQVAAGSYILRLTSGASQAVSERVTLIR